MHFVGHAEQQHGTTETKAQDQQGYYRNQQREGLEMGDASTTKRAASILLVLKLISINKSFILTAHGKWKVS